MIEFCEHNQINGIKYYLEKSPDDGIATRIEQHKKSCNAIKDATRLYKMESGTEHIKQLQKLGLLRC